MKTFLKYALFIAIVMTGLFGLMYAVIQQDIRQSANDPQIQMAEDAAVKLANGQPVQTIIPVEKINIATSLAPYLIIFDVTGKPIASSALLNDRTPSIPSGVFGEVSLIGEARFTWQPQPGVRSAVVVTQFKGSHPGFVLAGRSLREIEKREDAFLQIVIVGWIGMLFVTSVAMAIIFSNVLKDCKFAPCTPKKPTLSMP